MKIMTCPVNGPRNITEFVWGGEVKTEPDPALCTDQEWTAHLFLEDNRAGVIAEWWLHAPTNTWFIATRNTVTDEILATETVSAFFARKSAAATEAQA